MKAIVFDEIGSPLEVLQFRDVPIPPIREDEVLVKMLYASINPGDFLFIENLYPEPKKPHFPQQIAGGHGLGIISRVGTEVAHKPGTYVAFSYDGAWAEYTAVPGDWLIPLPANYPIEKGAQFMNLITAWDLLNESGVQPGQWLALTGGNSTVSTMILQMAKLRNVNVVSIVRRVQKDLDLKAMGASEVFELSTSRKTIGEMISEITQSAGLNGIIDCVGGPLLGDLIRLVAPGGQVVIYGGFSSEKFEIHNFDVLMRGVTIKPYAYRYFFTPPKNEHEATLRQIAELARPSGFTVPFGGTHSLEDFKVAVRETINHPERGKRFFKMESAAD